MSGPGRKSSQHHPHPQPVPRWSQMDSCSSPGRLLPRELALTPSARGTSPRVPGSQQGAGLQQPRGLAPRLGAAGCDKGARPWGQRRSAGVICLLPFACIAASAVNCRHLELLPPAQAR